MVYNMLYIGHLLIWDGENITKDGFENGGCNPIWRTAQKHF